MSYSVQTGIYEGPMDLLFDLINKNKIDIRDISIVEITDQYVEYVDSMQGIDLDTASDFIAMASKLLEIKSRYVLYQKDKSLDQEDPRLELVQKIEEYKKYKNISEDLLPRVSEYDRRYYRSAPNNHSSDLVYDLRSINLDKIIDILPSLFSDKDLVKMEEKLEKNQKLKTIIKNKIVSVEDKITYIREMLKDGAILDFSNISKEQDKKEIIASFLAVLEMVKLKEVQIVQEKFYDQIKIIKLNQE